MKEEMTKKIEELTKKLDCTKRRVNDLTMEIQHHCAENAEIERIEVIVAEMDRIFCLTEDLQWSYEDLLNENDLATKVQEWNAFHFTVMDARTTFHASGEGKELCNLRIPKWQLTSFDGVTMQFGAFWDQFQASVHSQTDLNDIEKFMYLRSSLKGPALDVISGFSTTATNYPEAKAVPSEVNRKWEELIESNTSISANLESFLEFVRIQIDIEEKVTFTKGIRSTGVEKCSTTTIHGNRSKGMPRLCLSCLKKGHRRIDCVASRKTATGQATIHDLLNKKDTECKKTDEKTEENITRIAQAVICSENGNRRIVDCILASGAQRSFVKKEIVESLGLNGPKEHITISTLNQRREHHKPMQGSERFRAHLNSELPF
ncbi:hypothetical protein T07_711 [Trichinella nelsoni]|uniref:CCHC-type domain-containing protein n=1 Tax=Trichinella nelsoni TaxID=6336 RepID=A0A0V0S249_9BILA|nr:hypothetical protein T07_711 [Trichinella nelsoni]